MFHDETSVAEPVVDQPKMIKKMDSSTVEVSHTTQPFNPNDMISQLSLAAVQHAASMTQDTAQPIQSIIMPAERVSDLAKVSHRGLGRSQDHVECVLLLSQEPIEPLPHTAPDPISQMAPLEKGEALKVDFATSARDDMGQLGGSQSPEVGVVYSLAAYEDRYLTCLKASSRSEPLALEDSLKSSSSLDVQIQHPLGRTIGLGSVRC